MPASTENKNTSNLSSTLEDRHFLSDPRAVPGLELPTWEVDVFREGVDMPIMTLKVDSCVLPPRKNKKKKVLWRLPDSIDTLPKFGEQDKKRILELFREKKKELKKLKNKQRAYRRASSMEASTKSSDSGSSIGEGDQIKNARDDSSTDANAAGDGLPPENRQQQSNADSPSSNAKDDGPSSTNESALPPPPPGLPLSSPLKPAPPGLPSQHRPPEMNGNSNYPPPTNGQIPPPPQYRPQTSRSSPPPPPPGLLNNQLPPLLSPQLPPLAVGPSFVLPPNAPPGLSIGKFVTETYYLCLQKGLIRELDAYFYTNNSVESGELMYKALTVGGAHAVCATPQDRWMQLNTFAGTEMRIKGVQEQPTVGKGILVLITGVSIRTTPGAAMNGSTSPPPQQQQQQLPFCHTLILKPVLADAVAATIGYQILNDNLVILTGED